MTGAREVILERIAAAGAGDAGGPIPREYNVAGVSAPGSDALVDLFEERLVDYRATVIRTTPDGIAGTVARVLAERAPVGAQLVVPPGLDAGWSRESTTVLVDDGTLSAGELDDADAVLTACSVAIAETGTIVLDGSPDQGRRALSLVPDLHLCVVRRDQVVDDVPDALRLLDPTRPLTFISGGSATSDIELQRVEGVHGPRTLVVLLVGD